MLNNGTWRYIASDLHRYAGRARLDDFFKQYALNKSFRYSVWLRLCRSSIRPIQAIAVVARKYYSDKYGIDIPRQVEIGYGLYIGHGMGVVVNPTARLGDNCNLSQFTTIGSNHGRAAQIGNDVYIGPGVCVVEDVVIGDGATIGAGAVVVKDVPANATVAGSPADVISWKHPGRYVHNRYRRDCD